MPLKHAIPLLNYSFQHKMVNMRIILKLKHDDMSFLLMFLLKLEKLLIMSLHQLHLLLLSLFL